MKRKSRTLRVENLETRQLMAGDVSFANGHLTVQMSADGSNQLTMASVGGYVSVQGNAQLNWFGQGRVPASAVTRITVNGSDRGDNIRLQSVNQTQFPNLQAVTVRGGKGNDDIIGTAVNDVIFGGKGRDTIRGQQGNDLIYGGQGNDQIYGGDGADRLYGEQGDDFLWGADYHADDRARDFIYGGQGYDTYGMRNRYVGLNDRLTSIEFDLRNTV